MGFPHRPDGRRTLDQRFGVGAYVEGLAKSAQREYRGAPVVLLRSPGDVLGGGMTRREVPIPPTESI